MFENNCVRKIARVEEKNGGVKGREGRAEELDIETGEEQRRVEKTIR